jgi:hypothetical protein
MVTQSKFRGIGQTASNIMGGAVRLVRRAVSSLSVWMLPIIVGVLVAAALTGGLSLHQGAGAKSDPDSTTVLGERPFMTVNVYYPPDYIDVVKTANQDGRDLLADFAALDSAWNAASPTPLVIKVVSSPLPEPITGKAASPILTATEVVDESSFKELRGLLEDLRTLILEGDGSGFGQLDRSGYQAQPGDRGQSAIKESPAKSRTITSGPAKPAPGPSSTF